MAQDPPLLAWNMVISFVTKTKWQTHVGAATMSHLPRMAALVVDEFLSAATGIAV